MPESTENLLCPGHTSNVLSGDGESLAELLSPQKHPIGEAILAQKIGKVLVVSLAYDLVETAIILRHGWSGYDKVSGSYYHGPTKTSSIET